MYICDLAEMEKRKKLSDEELSELNQIDISSESVSLAVSTIENNSEQIGQIANDLASIIVELELFGENTLQVEKTLKSLRTQLLSAKYKRRDFGTQAVYYASDAFVERIRLQLLTHFNINKSLTNFSDQDMAKISNYLYINGMIAKCKAEAVRISQSKWELIRDKMLAV